MRIEPVRAVFPDRQPRERETPDRRRQDKDTFEKALRDAEEREDGRPNDSGA